MTMMQSPKISIKPSNMDDDTAPTVLDSIALKASVKSMGNHFGVKQFRRSRLTANGKKKSPSGYNLFFHIVREHVLFCQNKESSGNAADIKQHLFFSKQVEDLFKYHMDYRLRMKPKRKHVKQNFPISLHELTHIVSKEWKSLIPPVRQMFLSQSIAETEYYRNKTAISKPQQQQPAIKQQRQQKQQNGSIGLNVTKITGDKINDLKMITSKQINPGKSNENLQQQRLPDTPRRPVLKLQTQLQSQCIDPHPLYIQPGIEEQDILDHDLKHNQDSLSECKIQSIKINEIQYELEPEITHPITNNEILEGPELTDRVVNKEKNDSINEMNFLVNNNSNAIEQSLLYGNVFGDLAFNSLPDDEASFNPIIEHTFELEYNFYPCQHRMDEIPNEKVDDKYDPSNHMHSLHDDCNEQETSLPSIDPIIMSDFEPNTTSNQSLNKNININEYTNVLNEKINNDMFIRESFLTNHRDDKEIQHNMMNEQLQQHQGMVDNYGFVNSNNIVSNNNRNQSYFTPSHPSLYHMQKIETIQFFSHSQHDMMLRLHENKHLLLDDINTSYPSVEKDQLNHSNNIIEKRKDLSILCGRQPYDYSLADVEPNPVNFMKQQGETDDKFSSVLLPEIMSLLSNLI